MWNDLPAFTRPRVLDILRHRLRHLRRGGLLGQDPVLRWLDRLPRHFGTAVDVGAYHGLFSRSLSKKCDLVLAVEPRCAAVAHLHNVLPKNCRALCVALSDQTGFLPLSTPLRDGRPDFALTFAPRTVPTPGPTLDWTTSATTLDQLVEDNLAGQRIGFIKIDVEGHELAVLRGAETTLISHRPLILAEAELRHGCDVEAFFDFLSARRYVATLPWRSEGQTISAADFLSLQSASDPNRSNYVNNVLFVPEGSGLDPGSAGS